MNYWFTSDTHFGHANIIRYDNRPFSSIEEHDDALITNWNAVVHPGDVVYHLGDVMWHTRDAKRDSILRSLHGTLILIKGNHDRTNKPLLRHKRWAKVCDYEEISIGGQRIMLFHYRMTVWNGCHRGSWALHGHSHGTLPVTMTARTLDVGTMCWNYRPINFDEVSAEMHMKRFVPVDAHHEGNQW